MESNPISCRIPEHLNRLKQTKQWLADQVGITKQQLNGYIKLKHLMGIQIARKIALVLKVSIDDLYLWGYPAAE